MLPSRKSVSTMLVYLATFAAGGAVWALRNVPGPDDPKGLAAKASIGAASGIYVAVVGPPTLLAHGTARLVEAMSEPWR